MVAVLVQIIGDCYDHVYISYWHPPLAKVLHGICIIDIMMTFQLYGWLTEIWIVNFTRLLQP
jgi:hypothetical protein